MHPAGGGRRHRQDFVTPIGAGQRLPLDRFIAGEIGHRHAASFVANGLGDLFGNAALIKGTRPVAGDCFESIG